MYASVLHLQPVLEMLDSRTRRELRLVNRSLCLAIDNATTSLTLHARAKTLLQLCEHTILHKCPKLRTVSITTCSGLVLGRLPHTVRHLHLDVNGKLNGMRFASSLISLSLSSSKITSIEALVSCFTLQTMDLSRCLKLFDISALASCSSLHTLDLSSCHMVADISALASCSSLHSLNLNRCYGMTDTSIFPSLSSLQTLDLSLNPFLVDISALASCSVLHTLNLSFSHVDISALASCSSLHTLDLSRCLKLVDISALASCSSLHTLDLSHNPKLVDISALASCSSLHTLSLIFCMNLDGISALASCPSLHTLDLSRRPGLSGSSHFYDYSVLASSRSLRSLDIRGFRILLGICGPYYLNFTACMLHVEGLGLLVSSLQCKDCPGHVHGTLEARNRI